MKRRHWTPRKLANLTATAPHRSGYPSLFLRLKADQMPPLPGGECFRVHYLPAEWEEWRPAIEAADRRCKYLDIIRHGPEIHLQWYGFTTFPGYSKVAALAPIADLIDALQEAGKRVDVLGPRSPIVRCGPYIVNASTNQVDDAPDSRYR